MPGVFNTGMRGLAGRPEGPFKRERERDRYTLIQEQRYCTYMYYMYIHTQRTVLDVAVGFIFLRLRVR